MLFRSGGILGDLATDDGVEYRVGDLHVPGDTIGAEIVDRIGWAAHSSAVIDPGIVGEREVVSAPIRRRGNGRGQSGAGLDVGRAPRLIDIEPLDRVFETVRDDPTIQPHTILSQG